MTQRKLLNSIAILTMLVGFGFSAVSIANAADVKPLVEACSTSPFNSSISYLFDTGKQRGISLTDSEGTTTGCLVNFNKAYAFSPSWSVDGKFLGIVLLDSSNPSSPQQWIYLISADAKLIKRLVSANEFAWSPNSTEIAFSKDGDIWVVSLNNGTPRNLTNKRAGAFSPTWSPDGRFIAYSQPDGIYTIDAATGANARNLTNSNGTDQFPVWSPDGRFIAFTGKRNGSEQVYAVNAQSAALALVSDAATFSNNPVWSPDSGKLAFLSAPSRKAFKDTRIVVANPDGSNRRRLTNAAQPEKNPSWSRDGQRVVFEMNLDKRDNQKIFLVNTDGSNPRQLIKTTGFENSPLWQPR